jgi:hypothetical protein
MSVGFVRPDVSELNLALLGRSVHPELIERFAQTTLTQDGFRATFAITDAGHLVELRAEKHTICEIVSPRGQLLPNRQRLLEKRLRGARDESLWLPGGIGYQLSFQIERLDPTIYLQVHEEFSRDCHKATLGYIFEPPNRLAPAAISYLNLSLFPRSLLIHAYHTFPENCAVVKTQTLFELPKSE